VVQAEEDIFQSLGYCLWNKRILSASR